MRAADADVDVDAHIFRVEGAGFTSTTTDYPLASGYVLAKTGSEGYAYKVVKTEDAATVTWDGASAEKWVAGSTPTHTVTNTAGSGKKTTYDLSALQGKGVVAGSSYNFKSVAVSNLEFRLGMDLYSEFHVSIYVKYDENVTYNYFMINGVRYEVANCELITIADVSGQFYKISFKVDPKNSADLIVVSAHINGTEEITVVTSILNYAKKLLASGSQSATTKKLMYSVVEYIGAAAAYAGDRYTNASCKALLASYSAYKTSVSISSTAPDTGAVKEAVKSVYLDLGTVPTFAFRFQNNFNGTVTISYTNASGNLVSVNVVVDGGKVQGTDSNVYLLEMRAYDMASDITITVGGESCIYNIDNYYTQAVQSADALYDLICTLKSYCVTAQAYKKA